MKIIGFVLITVGIALLVFVGYYFLQERNKLVSPLPQDRGVKVIFISPSP